MATSRERSPNYPAIGLREATDLIKRFYASEGQTTVDSQTAAIALGYGGLSGASRPKLGALKKYGLLHGRGEELTITPLGLRICHPEDDTDYLGAMREAAKTPELFASLIETHATASENAIVSFLVRTRGFTEDGARQVEKSFKDTLAVAKLDNGTYTPPSGKGDNLPPAKDKVMQPGTPAAASVLNTSTPPADSVLRTFTTGTDTMDAEIRITSHAGEITGDDIAFLKEYLSFLEKGWARRKPRTTINTASPAPQPLSAFMPIMITKQQESDLLAAGYTQEQINAMTPEQAHENLAKRLT